MYTYPKQTLFDTEERPQISNLSGQSTRIPIDRLISYRSRAGRKMQARSETKIEVPVWVQQNYQDEHFRYFNKADEELYNWPVLRQTGNGIEYPAFTFLSPAYRQILSRAAKREQQKRRAKQSYRERCAKSWVEKRSVSEALGNTGSNLDSYEKITREKRYRIQKFIQKNRLACNTVCTCGQPVSDYISIKKNNDHGNLSTGGIATCGSVWACPVCRAKIVNKRAKELRELYKAGLDRGLNWHMITFTFRHSRFDNLAEMYGSSTLGTGLSGAFTKFRQSRIWSKEFKPKMQLFGDVRSVEITWGRKNGFHPHIHLLVATEQEFSIEKWENKILGQWQKNCKSSGIGVPNEHGVKIDKIESEEMATYPAKWSVGSELSSDSAKQAEGGNYSIATLEYFLIDEKARGCTKEGFQVEEMAGVLKAYYAAMKGQKQLVYGGKKGWKKELLEQDEKTDKELADEQDELTEVLVLSKRLYQDLKTDDIFSDFIECLESLSQDVPNYTEMMFRRAEAFLFQHYSGGEIKMWRPKDRIEFDR